MMHAWAIDAFGLEHLHVVTRPVPVAGPGQVVVALHAASLNYRDLLMVEGRYNPRQPLPLVPCSDGAGVVVDVGPGVVRRKRGDRVMTLFAQGWSSGAPTLDKLKRTLGGPLDGTLATHIVVDEDGCTPIPDTWTFREAATIPCAGLTAWSALVEQGGLRAGQSVLILGTGGVSMFALQIATMMGAVPVVVTSTEAKLAAARAHGARMGILRGEHPQWGKRVRELVPGGVDHVVEVGGAGTLEQSLRAACIGGSVHVIGILAGAADVVNVIPVLMQNLRLQGVVVGHRDAQLAMTRALSTQDVRPIIDRAFAFDEVHAAFAHLQSGQHIGKIVVDLQRS